MAMSRLSKSQREDFRRYLAPDLVIPTEEPWSYEDQVRYVGATRLKFNRQLMEWAGAPACCPRKACRRAGKCRGENAPCFEEALPVLRDHVFPGLRKALNEARSAEAPSGSEEGES